MTSPRRVPRLEVDDVSVTFTQYERGLRRVRLEVVTGLDLAVDAGELVAVVGASGSGKSLLAHAVLGVLPGNAETGGEIRYDGAPLDEARREVLRGREIALVPQSMTFLDPLARVGSRASPTRPPRRPRPTPASTCPPAAPAATRTSCRAAWRGGC